MTGPSGREGAGASDARLDGLFERIPRVDAVRRRRRWWGLAGWSAANWLAWAAASVAFYFLYGGARAASGSLPAAGAWWALPLAVLAAGASGFVAASYLRRRGVRANVSVCSLAPLAGTLLAVPFLGDPNPVTGVLGVAMLGAFAVQRAAGASC